MSNDLYEILGVQMSATADQLKKAYRKKSKECHPDAGGNAEDQAKINQAYNILSDPEARKVYDETGATSKATSRREAAVQMLAQLITELITRAGTNITALDLLGKAKDSIHNGRTQAKETIKEQEEQVKALTLALSKLQCASEENLIGSILQGKLNESQKIVDSGREFLLITDMVLQMLKDYTYDFDKQSPRTRMGGFHFYNLNG